MNMNMNIDLAVLFFFLLVEVLFFLLPYTHTGTLIWQFCFPIGQRVKKRRFYSDDLKISIYLDLLAKTDPPVLHHGVSREVALKYGVP